jgi:hypothetical protein
MVLRIHISRRSQRTQRDETRSADFRATQRLKSGRKHEDSDQTRREGLKMARACYDVCTNAVARRES